MKPIRVLVSNLAFRGELLLHNPAEQMNLVPEEPEEGFGDEYLYPILVETEEFTLPVSVAALMLSTWLFEAWIRQGSLPDEVVGVEQNDLQDTISFSDSDVSRIAQRLKELLEEADPNEDN